MDWQRPQAKILINGISDFFKKGKRIYSTKYICMYLHLDLKFWDLRGKNFQLLHNHPKQRRLPNFFWLFSWICASYFQLNLCMVIRKSLQQKLCHSKENYRINSSKEMTKSDKTANFL